MPSRLLLTCALVLSCQSRTYASNPPAPAPVRRSAAVPASERKIDELLYAGGLKSGWMDYGWCERKLGPGPARLDFSNYSGWILAKPGTENRFGGLTFRYQAQPDSFDVRLEGFGKFPRVVPGPEYVVRAHGGFTEVFIPVEQLNPDGRRFEQVVFQGRKDGRLAPVLLDQIGLTVGDPAQAAGGKKPVGEAIEAKMAVDCQATPQPISPLIYGIAFNPQKARDADVWELGATARRWGGNPASRYNWRLGNAWNTAADWFFENVNYTGIEGFSYDHFLDENLTRKVQTALVMPMLGWVAKDVTSVGFPISRFPEQQATDSYRKEAGNGKSPSGKLLAPGSPALTSVPAPPELVAEWVKAIRAKDAKRGRSVQMYILDNEPMLWHETHRDVHPEPVSYDELLDRTVRYAAAIRKADPEAVIAGPAEWGWPAFFYSAVDKEAGTFLRPDRRRHGDVPLLPWYLRKLAEHEKKTGQRLLDVVDVHFYPQGKGQGLGHAAQTDPESSALRIRSTRALWDPTYEDESWIDDRVMLIPRLKQWIAQNYPGRAISIGEYNFGAEEHLSGGLAQAEVLGRFGQQGVFSAFYWTYPPKGSPAFWAFRAYRNFDGKGGRFLDLSVPARAEGNTSLFASRDASGRRLVLVALNFDPAKAASARIDLSSCGEVSAHRVYQYTGDPKGFVPTGKAPAEVTLPPYSITVLDLSMAAPKAAP